MARRVQPLEAGVDMRKTTKKPKQDNADLKKKRAVREIVRSHLENVTGGNNGGLDESVIAGCG